MRDPSRHVQFSLQQPSALAWSAEAPLEEITRSPHPEKREDAGTSQKARDGMQVQRGCGCIAGKDYPKPIVDHTVASKANMAKMHDAYDAIKEAEDSESRDHNSSAGVGGRTSSSRGARRRQTREPSVDSVHLSWA